MSDSHVIARRFRPQTFTAVVGQDAITRTLSNAIQTGRLHHAFLFAGARGVGKTTTARILAKAVNCVNGLTIDPCGVCPSCEEIARSSSMDVLEIDAASNTGVENVRSSIISSAPGAPWRDRYRIFIIDEVHQLSTSAFNALLKTLEEPPPQVLFIMATTELQKVPETILSRCQVFEFRTISLPKIAGELRRIAGEIPVTITDSALAAIARAGEGSMRDAESALDQVISFAGANITDDDVTGALGLVGFGTLNAIGEAIAAQDGKALLATVEDVVARGCDLRTFCKDLMTHFRSLLVIKLAGYDEELLQAPPGEKDSMMRLAEKFSEQDLIRFFTVLTKTEQDVRLSTQARFQVEIGLIKLAQARRLYLLEDAIERLETISGHNSANVASPDSLDKPVVRAESAGRPALSPRPSPASGSRAASTARPATPPPERTSEHQSAAPDFGEPPPFEPDDYSAPPEFNAPAPGNGSSGGHADTLKNWLQKNRKMVLLSTVDHAVAVDIDGDHLNIRFPLEGTVFKEKLEDKENRKIIETACLEAFGRKLILQAFAGTAASPDKRAEPEVTDKDRPENHPVVRSLVEKFHGEIIKD